MPFGSAPTNQSASLPWYVSSCLRFDSPTKSDESVESSTPTLPLKDPPCHGLSSAIHGCCRSSVLFPPHPPCRYLQVQVKKLVWRFASHHQQRLLVDHCPSPGLLDVILTSFHLDPSRPPSPQAFVLDQTPHHAALSGSLVIENKIPLSVFPETH